MDKGTRINVLDKGYVELVDYMGSDEYAIRAARMSTGRGFEGWEKDAGLHEYLYKNRHSTPFEMSELLLEVKAPIFVFREWHRHRTFSYNEFSARYSVMPDEHYIPSLARIQTQHQVNKQMSGESLPAPDAQMVVHQLEQEQHDVYRNYTWFLEKGVAREVSRINTPVSRYSKMWAKGNLKNWLGFLNLRMAGNAQWEIRQYANAIGKIIQGLWPRTYWLFQEYSLWAETVSFTEKGVLGALLRGEITPADVRAKLGDKAFDALVSRLG